MANNSAKKEAKQKSWMGQLLGYAKQNGYKEGWAFYAFEDKFGFFPADFNSVNVEPTEPTEEVVQWVAGYRKRQGVAMRKAQRKAEAAKLPSLRSQDYRYPDASA